MLNRYNKSHILHLYRDYLCAVNYSRVTIKSYVSDARLFLTWLEGRYLEDPLRCLNYECVKDFMSDMKLSQRLDRSVAKYKVSTRNFIGFLRKREVVTLNDPQPVVKVPTLQSSLVSYFRSKETNISQSKALSFLQSIHYGSEKP